jgi:parallel beta-helix repeat protein
VKNNLFTKYLSGMRTGIFCRGNHLQVKGPWLIIILILVSYPPVPVLSETVDSTIGDPDKKIAIYYIDPEGDDANSGRTPSAAWRTLQKVNRHEFKPSDRILFKRGGEWNDPLRISTQGTMESPIVVGAYGEGAAPRISNTHGLSSSGNMNRFAAVFENMNSNRSEPVQLKPSGLFTRTLPCRSGFQYKLKLFVRADGEASLRMQLLVNGNLYLQNEQIKGVMGKWNQHAEWIGVQKSLSQLKEISIVFQSPLVEIKTLQLNVKNTSDKARIQIHVVRLEPRWSEHPDYKNIFMLDTDLKLTELIYQGRRLSRADTIATTEDQSYFYKDGVWYLKDMKGNPEETGVSIQAVTAEQNAVLVTKSKYVILEGLDIRGGTGVRGYLGALGIYDSGHIEIRNSVVSNSINAAMMVFRSEHIRISKCDVSNGGLGGVYLCYCKDCFISENDIHHNGPCLHDLNDLHGIAISAGQRITIEYNHIHHNGYGGGSGEKGDSAVTLYSASDCIVRYNLIDQNWRGGISVDSGHEGNSDHTVVQNNIITDNGLLGPGGRYPALAIQAHEPSTSDDVLFENNTIIRHRTGNLWSLAAQRPLTASAGDRFRSRKCQGTVVFWKEAYLSAAITGTLSEGDVIESVDGRWKATLVSINSAPAAIVLMSPLTPVRGVLLQRNIVADTQGAYDLSVGKNVRVNLADNCFWKKSGSMMFREHALNRSFIRNERQEFLLKDPKFKDDRIPAGLIPEENECKEWGAQPQVWLDRVKTVRSVSALLPTP